MSEQYLAKKMAVKIKQDQGTSVQKTVWVWSGFDHWGAVNSYFSVYSAIFGMVTNNNNQPGDPRASLLLTSEKAVFCNFFT